VVLGKPRLQSRLNAVGRAKTELTATKERPTSFSRSNKMNEPGKETEQIATVCPLEASEKSQHFENKRSQVLGEEFVILDIRR
jgi:hypothetical protein